jgi:hypothetical protein
MARSCSVLFVWILCAFAASAQNPQRPSDQLDLRGEWELNESLSDEIPLLPGEALALARASGALRTGKRVVRSGPDPRRLSAVRQALRGELAAERLKIAHAAPAVTLTYGDGGALSIVADGRKAALEREGVRFTMVAHWSPPLLTIDREYEDGTVLSETFATFDGPRQLVATSTIQNSRTQEGPITFRRVFEIFVDDDR